MLGLVWGIVAYVVRIYLNLLVEPQINPIKHFPVVTVAAKIMLPFALTLTRHLRRAADAVSGVVIANVHRGGDRVLLAGCVRVPGLGAAFELAALRGEPARVAGPAGGGQPRRDGCPVSPAGFPLGHAAEAVCPAAAGACGPAGSGQALQHREALHHVEESVRRLVEREFAALLRESRSLGDRSIEPGSIHLATNRIRIELAERDRDRPSLWIDLEERSGMLAAGVSRPGWLDSLSAAERRTLADAVAGLYKISGVERVHRRVSAFPTSLATSVTTREPRVTEEPLAFSDIVIPWREWVEAWEAEAALAEQAADRPWRIDFPSCLLTCLVGPLSVILIQL